MLLKFNIMFLKYIAALPLTSIPVQNAETFDAYLHHDFSGESFLQMYEHSTKTSESFEHEYTFKNFDIQQVLTNGHIVEGSFLGAQNTDISETFNNPLLIRPSDEKGELVTGEADSDTITLLVRGGPVWLDDNKLSLNILYDKYKMFGTNDTADHYFLNYWALFNQSMTSHLIDTDIYMLNEEQFFVDQNAFYNSLALKSENDKLLEYFKINFLNMHHLKRALEELHGRFPNKKIKLWTWSYGSMIGNATFSLWPELINKVENWAVIGTSFEQEKSSMFSTLENGYEMLTNGTRHELLTPTSSIANKSFFYNINTAMINNFEALTALSKIDNVDYINEIKKSNKVLFFQNTFDNNVGHMTPDELLDLAKLGEVFLDQNDWEKENILSNDINDLLKRRINHYSFKEYAKFGSLLLDKMNYE